MILVLGSVTVRDGMIDEAVKLSKEHVNRSRSEPGSVSHAVHRDCEDPNRLAFVAALTAVAIGAPSMTIYAASRVGP